VKEHIPINLKKPHDLGFMLLSDHVRPIFQQKRDMAKFMRSAYDSTEIGGLVDTLCDEGYDVRLTGLEDFTNGVVVGFKHKRIWKVAQENESIRVQFDRCIDVIVVFRGSNGLSFDDWKYNLQFWGNGSWWDKKNVHSGFAERANRLSSKLDNLISNYLTVFQINNDFCLSFTFIGHSQGAALALLMSLKYQDPTNSSSFNQHLYTTTKVFTFAFPGAFKRMHDVNGSALDNLYVRHYNYNILKDPIPIFGWHSGYDLVATSNNIIQSSVMSSCHALDYHLPLLYSITVHDIGNCEFGCKKDRFENYSRKVFTHVVSEREWDNEIGLNSFVFSTCCSAVIVNTWLDCIGCFWLSCCCVDRSLVCCKPRRSQCLGAVFHCYSCLCGSPVCYFPYYFCANIVCCPIRFGARFGVGCSNCLCHFYS
jgi:hypothetical protein